MGWSRKPRARREARVSVDPVCCNVIEIEAVNDCRVGKLGGWTGQDIADRLPDPPSPRHELLI